MRKKWTANCLRIGIATMLVIAGLGLWGQESLATTKYHSLEDMSEKEKEAYLLAKKYEDNQSMSMAISFPSKYFNKKSVKTSKISAGKQGILPSKYDSRNNGVVSTVKNQDISGCCWAFAIAESVQDSYASANSGTKLDLSEAQLAYFMYNQPTDGLSLLREDKVAGRNEDGKKVENGSCEFYNIGGNPWLSIFGISRGIGFTNENEVSFKDLLKAINKGKTYIPKESQCYPANEYRLTDAYIVSVDEESNVIKQMVMEKGAGTIAYNNSAEGYDYTTYAYYNPDSKPGKTNHAVTIVGWDDNYSRRNFFNEPEHDGAWLIKNSWGKGWGNAGYFWLSYDEPSIQSGTVYFYDADTCLYDHIYQYDGTMSYDTIEKEYTHSANVFTAKQSELLKAVSFHTVESNTDCEVRIYKNVKGEKPTDGDMVTELTGLYYKQPGYHSIELDDVIELEQGEVFSVVIKETLNGDATTIYVDRDHDNKWVVSDSSSEFGESYVSMDGMNWEDLSADGNSNVRIKAFADVKEEEIQGTLEFEEESYEVTANEPTILNVKMGNQIVNDKVHLTFTVDEVDGKDIADVDDLGNVTGKLAGKTKVTVAYAGQSATCELTVKVIPVEKIEKEIGYATKENPVKTRVGNKVQLEWSLQPIGAIADITWKIAEGKVGACVDQTNKFIASQSGLYRVIATATGVNGESVSEDFYVLAEYDLTECSDDITKMQYMPYDNRQMKFFTYASDDVNDYIVTFSDDSLLEDQYDYLYVYGVGVDCTLDTIYKDVDIIHNQNNENWLEDNDWEDEDWIEEDPATRCEYFGRYTGEELKERNLRIQGDKVVLVFVSDEYTTANGFRVTNIEATRPIESITTTENEITVEAGTNTMLKDLPFTFYPSDYNNEVLYRSDNEKIVTIDKDGTMHAQKEGSATITLLSFMNAGYGTGDYMNEDEDYWDEEEIPYVKATLKVIVTAMDLKSLTFKDSELVLTRNEKKQIDFVEELADKYVITYTSDHPGIVSVNEDGEIVAAGIGTATITASIGNLTSELSVTVSAPNPMTLDDLQSPHDYMDGMDEYYEYKSTNESVSCLKLRFDNRSELDSYDRLEVLDRDGNLIKKYRDWIGSATVIVPGNTVKFHLVTSMTAADDDYSDDDYGDDDFYYDDDDEDDASPSPSVAYGFRVKSIEEGVIPTAISLEDITLDISGYDDSSDCLNPKLEPEGAIADIRYELENTDIADILYDDYDNARAIQGKLNGETNITATAYGTDGNVIIGADGKPLAVTEKVTVKGNAIDSLEWRDENGNIVNEITMYNDDQVSAPIHVTPDDSTEKINFIFEPSDIVAANQYGNLVEFSTEELNIEEPMDVQVIAVSGTEKIRTEKALTIHVIPYNKEEYENDEIDVQKAQYYGLSFDEVGYNDGNNGKTAEEMTIEDIQSPHDYVYDTKVAWSYRSSGAESVKITFSKKTYLEYECDWVYIYNAAGDLLYYLTGSQIYDNNGIKIKDSKTLTIPGDGFKIGMSSDDDEGSEEWGFALTSIEPIVSDISPTDSEPDDSKPGSTDEKMSDEESEDVKKDDSTPDGSQEKTSDKEPEDVRKGESMPDDAGKKSSDEESEDLKKNDSTQDSQQEKSSDIKPKDVNKNESTAVGMNTNEKQSDVRTTNVKVSSLKLTGISHYLAPGKKLILSATVLPVNATNTTVVYKSSNVQYATVSKYGVVKATKKGAGKTVTITATAEDGSGVYETYKIKISKKPVKLIKVTAAKSAKAGEKVKIKVKVNPKKGAYTKVLYTCLTPEYAKVTPKGVVTINKNVNKKTVKIRVSTLDGTNKKKTIKIKVQ